MFLIFLLRFFFVSYFCFVFLYYFFMNMQINLLNTGRTQVFGNRVLRKILGVIVESSKFLKKNEMG
jgi:hypothetical protein